MIRNFLLVGLGGAVGSMLRYGSGLIIPSKNFPLATLLVNVAGSFIIGVVIAYSLRSEIFAANWKLFLATGICGGFTTFSAFSLENLQLLQNGKFAVFALYIVASLLLGLISVWAGFKFFGSI
jgi:fluoride exporter